MDQSGGTEFDAAGHAAADGAQPGPGHSADDDQFRAHHRRAGPAAAGAWHATAAAQPGHHIAGDFHDAADHGTGLERRVRQRDRALHGPASDMTFEEAWQEGSLPIKRFMSQQIRRCRNGDDVYLFYDTCRQRHASAGDV